MSDSSVIHRLRLSVRIILFAFFPLLFFIPVSFADQTNVSPNINIAGTQQIFITPALDICATAHLGSCAIYLTVNENFNQQVPTSISVDHSILQPGDSLAVTTNVNPSIPSGNLNFIFTFTNKSYTYSYPLTSLPAIGTNNAISISVPVGALTATLGLPPLPISLNINGQISSTIIGQMQGVGFSGNPSMIWNAAGSQTATLQFLGTSETSSLNLNVLNSVQNTSLSLSIGVPLIGQVPLYSSPVTSLQFTSNGASAFTWYHVSVNSQYSIVSGSGWYVTGNSATILVSDSTVNIRQGERRIFNGWQGSGSGSYSGSDQTHVLLVNSPVSENAQWKIQYMITVENPIGGQITPSISSNWYDSGYKISLHATPDNSYQFSGWTVNGQTVSTSPDYVYTANGPADISAGFTRVQAQGQSPSIQNSNQGAQGTNPSGIDMNTLIIAIAVIAAGVIIAFSVFYVRSHPRKKHIIKHRRKR